MPFADTIRTFVCNGVNISFNGKRELITCTPRSQESPFIIFRLGRCYSISFCTRQSVARPLGKRVSYPPKVSVLSSFARQCHMTFNLNEALIKEVFPCYVISKVFGFPKNFG